MENKINMELIRAKLYDLEISLERLQGLKETLEQLIADAEVEDIRINAIVKALENELEDANELLNDVEHETMTNKEA